MVEKRNVYRLLVGKPEGKRPIGRPRHRLIDNIKMDLLRYKIECCGLDWFGSESVQIESACELGNEPSGFIKCWETTDWLHSWWHLE
jgi:hypothetical protein